MTRKTWLRDGRDRAGQLAYANLVDLLSILQWNVQHDIHVYRMSSDLFPWMSEYQFEDLPNFPQLQHRLTQVGDYIKQHGLRISFHPGQFNVLASPTDDIVRRTVWELDQHSRIMDLMGLTTDYNSAINIHIGGSYGDKVSALDRFCHNFEQLAPSTKSRLVVENDDKPTQYSVHDLYYLVYQKVGTPVTFDHFHHTLHTDNMSHMDAAHLAASTWGKYTPLQHYSDSRKIHEDASVNSRAHSDHLYSTIPSYGLTPDVELEVKQKDLALIQYRSRTFLEVVS
jgi:UV DNA damage endonuclease